MERFNRNTKTIGIVVGVFILFILPSLIFSETITHTTKEDFESGTITGLEILDEGTITLKRKNFLENSSFELESKIEGLAENFHIYNPSGGDYTTELDTTTFTHGLRSQKITYNSNSDQAICLIQTVRNLETTTDYTFSADVKVNDLQNMDIKLIIELWGNGQYISSVSSEVIDSVNFTRISTTVNTTINTDEIRAIVQLIPKFVGAIGSMWVDRAQLEQSSSYTSYCVGYGTDNGTYTSAPIDLGLITTPFKIDWTSSVKNGCLKFQMRSALDSAGLEIAQWYGPTSTTDYYISYGAIGDNLLSNPSLEDDSANVGIPDYTRQAGWGENNRVFTVVDDAYEGLKAVKVEITDYTNGDARWEILYDGLIEKNHFYSFSLWHKENEDIGNIGMCVGLTKMDGTEIWWYDGKSVQSSADWKKDVFVFCTPDYEVRKIWLKLMLRQVGWIITDVYSLKKRNEGSAWAINSVHQDSRWIQYKGYFLTIDSAYSPLLYDISIDYESSTPDIHWVNMFDDNERLRYAFLPEENVHFKVEVVDFKGAQNLDHVNISIIDSSGSIWVNNALMNPGDTISSVKRYYTYQFNFPVNAPLGLWKAVITVLNNDGETYTENSFLKLRQVYTSPPQKMTLGALAYDYGFNGDVLVDIEEYSKYLGLEIWKLGISWDHLEPDPGSLDEAYVNKILEFMDGANVHGAKVQITIAQTLWPAWVNNGHGDNEQRYNYEVTKRLANTWSLLAQRLKDHPALESYLIINEENHVWKVGADVYLRALNKVVSAIRSVDTNSNHIITIRPNTTKSYLRSRIAQDGIQDYDYGNTAYPTSSSWWFTNYESPMSYSSYLRMSRLRSSPLAYGSAGGVGEIGFMKTPMDTFGDEEKLFGFKRALSIAYDQGMDEFMLWQSVMSFEDPETYFSQLREFRDSLITQPRLNHFNIRVLIDNNEWLWVESNASKLNLSIQPYLSLVKVLDEEGYTWFYTHRDAESLQSVSYDTTLKFSEVKWKTESEIYAMIENITPAGKYYPWTITSVNESNKTQIFIYSLSQNYPNPFSLTTRFNYSLPKQCNVEFSIYNILGQKVKTLVDEMQDSGIYSIYWNGTDSWHKKCPCGIYFYRLITENFFDTRKLLLMR